MYETSGAGVTVYSFMFEVGLIVTIDILIPVLDQIYCCRSLQQL